MNERAKAILQFWFNESSMDEKFSNNAVFDQKIKENFYFDYKKAINMNSINGKITIRSAWH